jgi:hypothetical protein
MNGANIDDAMREGLAEQEPTHIPKGRMNG